MRIPRERYWRAVALISVLMAAAPSWATPTEQANEIAEKMRRRGDAIGEIHLAVASFFARQQMPRQVFANLKAARRLGVSSSRVDLVLADFYRRQARYDAALSTFVRILVQSPRQPFALVQLWRTLYEAKLRQAALRIDTAMVRERLLSNGLFFPSKIDIGADAADRSKKVTADGYNALLGGKPRFAIEMFKEALEIFPGNARAHRGLGIAWSQQQNGRKSVGAYLLYLQLDPTASDAEEVDQALVKHWRRSAE